MNFDQIESQRLKDEGMLKAARKRVSDLELARGYARDLGGTVKFQAIGITIDDVLRRMEIRGDPVDLGNAAGSVFKTKDWYTKGETRMSTRVSRHRGRLLIWYLKG